MDSTMEYDLFLPPKLKLADVRRGNAQRDAEESEFTTDVMRIHIIERMLEDALPYFQWSVFLGESEDFSLRGVSYTMELAQAAAIDATSKLLSKAQEQLLNYAGLCVMQHGSRVSDRKAIEISQNAEDSKPTAC